MTGQEERQGLFSEESHITYSRMSSETYAEVVQYLEKVLSLRVGGLQEVVHSGDSSYVLGVQVDVGSASTPDRSTDVRGDLQGLNNIVFGETNFPPAYREGGVLHNSGSGESSEE